VGQLREAGGARIHPLVAAVTPSGDIFVQPEMPSTPSPVGANFSFTEEALSAGLHSINPVNDPLLFAVTLAGEDAILLGNMQSPNSGLLERVAHASNMTQAHMHDAWTWAELWQYTQGGSPSGLANFVLELKSALTGSQLASDVGIVTESPDGTLVMYRPPSAHGVVRVMSVLLLFASAVVLGIGWRYGSTPGMYPYVEDCRL
jgi:hypothetical protein